MKGTKSVDVLNCVGVIARTVTDVKILNSIFSDGPKQYKSIDVSKLRLGYPINIWQDVGDEVSPGPLISASFLACV